MNYYQLLNETLETKLTKPFLKNKITLYHGSPKKLEIINPNKAQVNVGTKLSKPRFSTWWCRDPWYPIYFASHRSGVFYKFLQEYLGKNINKVFFSDYYIFDNVMKKIYMNEKLKNLYKKHFNDVICYLHSITIDTKDVGRGHHYQTEEFTIDKPVKVDNIETITFKKLYDKIIWIPESEMHLRAANENTYKNMDYSYKPNMMEKLIYHSDKDTDCLRTKYRYLNWNSKGRFKENFKDNKEM